MRSLKLLAGASRLGIIALRYRLDGLLGRRAPWPLRWLRPLVGKARPDIDQLPTATRVRLALEHLGPIFVKCGQILSTRRDLLPPEMIDELAMLQDQAAPFDGRQAVAAVEKALGKPVGELFAAFDETALASASIAQVHAARLHSGRRSWSACCGRKCTSRWRATWRCCMPSPASLTATIRGQNASAPGR